MTRPQSVIAPQTCHSSIKQPTGGGADDTNQQPPCCVCWPRRDVRYSAAGDGASRSAAAGSHEQSVLSRSRGTRGGESRRRETRGTRRRRFLGRGGRGGRCRFRGRVGVRRRVLSRPAVGGRTSRAAVGAHSAVRVPGVLRLRPAAHPAVPVGSPGLQPVPPEAELLPDLPRPAESEHPEPGHGEGGVHAAVPLQVLGGRLPAVPPSQREARPRGGVRVPPVHLPVSRRHLQVARLAGGRHAAPDARPQVHHHAAGRGHRLPGDGHQPAGRRGLGDDAVLLQPPLHAGPGEAGEVRRPPAVLRRRAAHRHPEAGRQLRLPPGAQRQPPPAHLGGHAPLHPRRRGGGHRQQRLPGVRHLRRAPVRRQRQPGHQRHHLHVLSGERGGETAFPPRRSRQQLLGFPGRNLRAASSRSTDSPFVPLMN